MYAAVSLDVPLPGCTEELCQKRCSEYANKYKVAVTVSECSNPDTCHCECCARQPLTSEDMGLANAEGHHGKII